MIIPRAAIVVAILLAIFTFSATAQAPLPIRADDGTLIANHPVSAELEGRIARLPGIVVVGNPEGDVTLAEFYDLNCPYCRKAAADIAEMIRTDRKLRVVLVPFPVLGIPSILAGRVELAVARLAPPQKFYEFHRKIYAGRGVVDGNRALSVARDLGVDERAVLAIANEDTVTETMKAHARLGDALGLAATPSYVIKGVAIVGHPGRKALQSAVRSVRRCGKVIC